MKRVQCITYLYVHELLCFTFVFYFSFQIDALTPHLSNLQIYCTSDMEEQGKTDFPFKIKPDCSVFAKGHSFRGTDSSAVELFIEFKRRHDDDPFVSKLPRPRTSSSDNTSSSPPPNPFMKVSRDARHTCGQITAYATSHMSAQYRTHVFFVLICKDYARLIRWDRSGAIVTDPIYYDEESHLFDFFIRLDHSPPNVRGQDTTVRLANPEDTKDAVKAVKELEELQKSQTPLLVVYVPNPAAGEEPPLLQYIIASPSASPWIPVGRWTRTSIGYDIQRKRSIFMKDSWRLAIDGMLKEGDVYSKFKANAVPNVPRCSNSGDIGDDTYHSTQTDQIERTNWAPNYAYDLTPHRHYRLILDDIGQPLDSFKCSRDMVRAVCAALIGKFFLSRVEVYLTELYTPVAHESAYKCGILHRDISPGNILITSDNNFDGGLLIDWDLCKDLNSQVSGPRRAARTVRMKFLLIRWVLMNSD